jgi:hypothetical protein
MKKTLLFIFLVATSHFFSQTFSTGIQPLFSNTGVEILEAEIEVNATTTTLTISGPSNVWLGIGFGGESMYDGVDIFMTDGTSIDDAYSNDKVMPPEDTQQDWDLVSNTLFSSTSRRTMVVTRPNDTGDEKDFVFNASAGSLSIIYAIGNSKTYAKHSFENRGFAVLELSSTSTAGVSEAERLDFEMFPNPASEEITIQLPVGSNDASIKLYDYIGRLALSKKITLSENTIRVQGLSSGMYILKVLSDDKIGAKKFIKE